jgi:uncharacterized protein
VVKSQVPMASIPSEIPDELDQRSVLTNPTVRSLTELDRKDLETFLGRTPVESVHMRSRIEDNGIVSAANRGRFYGCWHQGQLVAVALLGHSVLVQGDKSAFEGFARIVVESDIKPHVVFGAQSDVAVICSHLSNYGRNARLSRTYAWCESNSAAGTISRMQLARANAAELSVVANAQAEMALEESGVDPRCTDPDGFMERVAERIRKGRVWVKIVDGKVVFKADLVSVTRDVAYAEGVWTHPEHRQRGVARSCVIELVHRLLRHHKHVCLIADPSFNVATHLYVAAGFHRRGTYEARFF